MSSKVGSGSLEGVVAEEGEGVVNFLQEHTQCQRLKARGRKAEISAQSALAKALPAANSKGPMLSFQSALLFSTFFTTWQVY